MSAAEDLTARDWAFWHAWTEAQRALAAEVDRALQAETGISKAEFSVLVTLRQAAEDRLRVGDLAGALRWDKSRVSHLLDRMEGRDLVHREEDGAPGRRTAVRLSPAGREAVDAAVRVHAGLVRRLFFDRLEADERAAIGRWSAQMVDPAPTTGD